MSYESYNSRVGLRYTHYICRLNNVTHNHNFYYYNLVKVFDTTYIIHAYKITSWVIKFNYHQASDKTQV